MSDHPPLRRAKVHQLGELAGHLTERPGGAWVFTYLDSYTAPPISLTMPVRPAPYEFPSLPPALEGLLPEGLQLESLLSDHVGAGCRGGNFLAGRPAVASPPADQARLARTLPS